jgi:hypothetical protein
MRPRRQTPEQADLMRPRRQTPRSGDLRAATRFTDAAAGRFESRSDFHQNDGKFSTAIVSKVETA